MIKNFKIFNNSNNKKVIFYTQNYIDKNKVNNIINIISQEWITKNPVAFEVFQDKLYLTEGHHRFEACLKLKNKELLKTLFNTALYYNVNWQPKYFKKIILDL